VAKIETFRHGMCILNSDWLYSRKMPRNKNNHQGEIQAIPENFFRQQFEADQLRNERFRFLLLLLVLITLIIIVGIIFIYYWKGILKIVNDRFAFNWVFVLIGILIVRSLSIRYYLARRLPKNKPLHPLQRYVNAVIEVSIPSVAIIILAQNMLPMHALITPAVFLYFIFILISALEMDWKLSVFTGFIAGVEFLFIAMYYLHISDSPANLTILYLPAPYIVKSAIIMLCGAIAGLITLELKKRVIDRYRIQAERSRLENLFSQQVSAEIVDELIHNQSELAGKKQFVCILFLDIRGFTRYCRNRSPEEIIKFQNDVFSFMIDIILNQHGIINQFLGDGFMATFGAPVSRGNPCENAVRAAQSIHEELKSRSANGQIPSTEIGIGIHAGDAVTGNVGTSSRQQYSVTGNVVILAARLEQLNKELHSNILISKEVLDRLSAKPSSCKTLGSVEIRGMGKAVEVFQLA
jgi:adenylate cyclase